MTKEESRTSSGNSRKRSDSFVDEDDIHYQEEYERYRHSPVYGKGCLILLNLIFIIIACVVAIERTNKSYNTVASSDWVLVGGITESSVSFRLRVDVLSAYHRLVVSTSPIDAYSKTDPSIVSDQTLDGATEFSFTADGSRKLAETITVQNLENSRTYYYARVAGDEFIVRRGHVKTAPPAGQRTSFKFATGGCAMSGSTHEVFSEIAKDEDLLFFLHLGDYHYFDINDENVAVRFEEGIDKVMGSASQAELYSKMAFTVMWDDHDWLGNDSLGYGPGRDAALESYLQAFPYHPPLHSQNTSMYHAFTIGSVRFIISDLRSESTETRILSTEQKGWLFNEIAQADQYDFLVWVTPSPWIGEAEEGEDNWMGRAADRRDVSNYISEQLATTQNLIAISSDAHMVAFDDGSNTYYGDEESAMSFPILQSGPLDRLGSIKGGPYSDGCTTYLYERNHQWSEIEFQAEGTEPCLEIKSYRMSMTDGREEIFSRKLCGQIFTSSAESTEGNCQAPWFSIVNMAMITTGACMLVIVYIETCFSERTYWGSFFISALVTICFGFTMIASFYIPLSRGYGQYDTFANGLVGFCQILTMVIFLGLWARHVRVLRRLNNS